MKRVLLFLLIAVLVWVLPAQASPYGYKIDVSAMKALESSSSFPVRVTQKKVVEECYDTDSMGAPCDQLSFTVENGCAEEISGFRLFYVAYDETEATQKIDSTSGISFSISSSEGPELYSVAATDLALPARDSIEAGLPVHWKTFVGVRAIISEYTAADGTVVSNPDFPAWQTLAYGMVSDNSTELD